MSKAGRLFLFFDIVAGAVFCLMFVLELSNIVLRYFFASGIPESNELAGYAMIVFTFLGMIHGFKEDSHVNFDLLTQTKSPSINNWLKYTSIGLTVVLLLILFIYSVIVTISLYKAGLTGISVPWLPIWTVHSILPIGFGFSLYAIIRYRFRAGARI